MDREKNQNTKFLLIGIQYLKTSEELHLSLG